MKFERAITEEIIEKRDSRIILGLEDNNNNNKQQQHFLSGRNYQRKDNHRKL
jgi:hypothetical protein